MIIKKLKLIRNNVVFEMNFSDKINIINASDNQFGKTTIIYSILFALGVKENVFQDMQKTPDIVILTTNNGVITRSYSTWMIDDTPIKSSVHLTELIYPSLPDTRKPGGGFGQMQYLYLIKNMTLIQKREDQSENTFWINQIPDTKKDILTFLSGFDQYDHLINELKKISEIQKENKIIKNNIKLGNYHLNIEVDELNDFTDISKKIMTLKNQVRKTYTQEGKQNSIINEFDNQIEYVNSVNIFIQEILDIDVMKSVEDAEPIKSFLLKRFGVGNQRSHSLAEVENAKIKISESIANRKYLYDEIKKQEILAEEIVEDKELHKKLITYAIAKKTNANIIDDTDQKNIVKKLKTYRNEYMNIIENEMLNKMRDIEIQTSDSGLGQIVKYIIKRNKWSNKIEVPLIIDSINEVATNKNFISKIMPLLEENNGQVIITTTEQDIENSDGILVKNIHSKILE